MHPSYNRKLKGLSKFLSLAKNHEDLADLLHDVFTESEINKAHERVKIFGGLQKGLSQRRIKQKFKAAIATISHGAIFLKKQALIVDKIIAVAQKMKWWNSLFWRV